MTTLHDTELQAVPGFDDAPVEEPGVDVAGDEDEHPTSPARDESGGRSIADLAATAIRIVVWTFANLTFLLGAWVLVGWSLAGWSPVVVTSDSMRPTLDAGDVILVGDSDAVGQRDVIVFERDDALIAHRVFAVEDGYYVTKGDANASPDTDPVAPDDVIGKGKLVIPMVGLPIVWAQNGQWLPFAGWALLTGAGIIGTALAAERGIRRRTTTDRSAAVSVARVGIQRVRMLTAILIGGQLFISREQLDVRDTDVLLQIGAALILIATNALGTVRARRNGSDRVWALFELAVDTGLVVVLATATDSGLSWILFALPIIEAAVRFRLVGALLHWMVLTGVTVALELWNSGAQTATETVKDLETRLDQLGVLFLFVIPAAYLAEQLLGEVSTWQRATGQARQRGELLARVADVGRDVVRLDGGHLDAIVSGVRSVGFDRADVVFDHGDGRQTVLAGDVLTTPGAPGSATRHNDPVGAGAVVTLDDPDSGERDALTEHGLHALVAQVVSDQAGRRIILRGGIDAGHELTAERIEAFRLLAGQAMVALQNEQLMSEITSMHDELEHRASHDELTGLPNRALLLRTLRDALAAGDEAAVLFLDLNGFKPVNDRLGHDAGDLVLQRVAQRLRSAAPTSALVARLGGDEFTILLRGRAVTERMELAERIVGQIAAPIEVGEQLVNISTSIGIALNQHDCDDVELVRRADVAMYEAKHGSGTGKIETYRPELDLDAERRGRLVSDISVAIATRGLHLVYQPIIDVCGTHRIVGAEALLRWDHPTYGRIPPHETIEVANAANLSESLNAFIVQTAIDWVAVAQRVTRDPSLYVTINASPEELSSTALAQHVHAGVVRSGVSTSAIAVEISERLVTPVSESAERNMAELQRMGIRLLLDDFGEGTTSLSYLQELPIDGVKLDRRLVVNALRSRTDRLVLDSIVKLSARIGHDVIAEGIETTEHLDAVVEAGCTLVQGYLLFRPLGGDDLISLLCDQALELRNPDDDWRRPLIDPNARFGTESVLPPPSSPAALDAPAPLTEPTSWDGGR